MFKTIGVAVIFLAVSAVAWAESADCDRRAKQAEKGQAVYAPPESVKVIGTGRLYFHSAPDKNCRNKTVFVIPNDGLAAYAEYQGWTSVMYVNRKTSEDFEGWVESARLEFSGTLGPKN